ncbi:putative Acetyl-CoA acetyltransferase, cytosolic 1 [Blattamonas nauphoetae]|uniref:Acetyl-CoA acetyltransferase, cytosolic 1 n=1 Tax=Blattamonas nauphoetae TaxID=2049346 RepID=A0ABQ9YHR8_9EUKA|nr:putative Acetyl-CoA acetyltransferase, cytosolic 1 [Blattamonas nauphoetae]
MSSRLREVCIIGYARTPMGTLLGSLSPLTATDLGAIAIKEAVKRSKVTPSRIQSVFLGNVLQAGVGMGPARTAALKAGLNETTVCTTVNKVCASGMKAIHLAAMEIQMGLHDFAVAGGMESMTNAPFLDRSARQGHKFGSKVLEDCIQVDGLSDSILGMQMGMISEEYSKKLEITREQQDDFALQSYRRAVEAWDTGKFAREVVPVEIPQPKGQKRIVDRDERLLQFNEEKMKHLKPVVPDGTITAANGSSINDGAAAVVLASLEMCEKENIPILAIIESYADAERAPKDFGLTPVDAVTLALKRANLAKSEIDLFEINEAFSVVALANAKMLEFNFEKLNIFGGAVALGHPIGASGCRVVCTLLNALETTNKHIGCATICNGGGGASAIVIRRP